MHYYLLAIVAVGTWLFKTGKLNFVVKKGLQKAYASLLKNSEDFEDFIVLKKKRELVDIETGVYFYKADKGVMDTISYLDFNIDFSLSFNVNKKLLKQSIILTKGSVKHKFTVEGEYSTEGSVVTFIPTEGDLSVLPESMRHSEIKFVVSKNDEGLLVSFNEDQFGENNALFFETH